MHMLVNKYLSIILFILQSGLQPDDRDREANQTIMHMLVNKYLSIILFILQSGLQPDDRDRDIPKVVGNVQSSGHHFDFCPMYERLH